MLSSLFFTCQIVITLSQTFHQGYTSKCFDSKGDLCWFFNDDQCVGSYEGWARSECPFRCGYCKELPPCVDKIVNCEDYEDDLCTNPSLAAFARKNCRKYCHKCSYPGKMATVSQMTTSSPYLTRNVSDCRDDPGKDCWAISDAKCVGKFAPWAKRHCAYRCGYCSDKPPCINLVSNCDEYGSDLCTNVHFGEFARKNCRKYCNMCFQQTSQSTKGITRSTSTVYDLVSTKGRPSTTDNAGIICEDMMHNCAAYGKDLCVNKLYSDFARTYCRKFCFECPAGSTNSEVKETNKCEDKRPNCGAYGDDICTNAMYADFALQYCRKYCNKC